MKNGFSPIQQLIGYTPRLPCRWLTVARCFQPSSPGRETGAWLGPWREKGSLFRDRVFGNPVKGTLFGTPPLRELPDRRAGVPLAHRDVGHQEDRVGLLACAGASRDDGATVHPVVELSGDASESIPGACEKGSRVTLTGWIDSILNTKRRIELGLLSDPFASFGG